MATQKSPRNRTPSIAATSVDLLTGEVHAFKSLRPRHSDRGRTRKRPRANYSTMYNPALAEMVETDGLTFGELRVLLWLIARAPLGECQTISKARIAGRLGIHRHTVERALEALLARGWVVREPDDPGCLWVNPHLAYRGYEDEFEPLAERLGVAT